MSNPRPWDPDWRPAEPAGAVPVPAADGLADDLVPQLRQISAALLRDYISQLLAANQPPTVTATTATGHTAVVLDAQNRSFRTLVQGLAVDVLVALGVAVGDLAHVDLASTHGWTIIGLSLTKTALTAAVSYLARLKVSPATQR